jgi:hypothetical protein
MRIRLVSLSVLVMLWGPALQPRGLSLLMRTERMRLQGLVATILLPFAGCWQLCGTLCAFDGRLSINA